MAMVLAIMNSQRMAKVKQNANVIRVFKMMAQIFAESALIRCLTTLIATTQDSG